MGDTALLGLLGAYDSDEEDKEMQIASPINEGLQLGILSLESSRNGENINLHPICSSQSLERTFAVL